MFPSFFKKKGKDTIKFYKRKYHFVNLWIFLVQLTKFIPILLHFFLTSEDQTIHCCEYIATLKIRNQPLSLWTKYSNSNHISIVVAGTRLNLECSSVVGWGVSLCTAKHRVTPNRLHTNPSIIKHVIYTYCRYTGWHLPQIQRKTTTPFLLWAGSRFPYPRRSRLECEGDEHLKCD